MESSHIITSTFRIKDFEGIWFYKWIKNWSSQLGKQIAVIKKYIRL